LLVIALGNVLSIFVAGSPMLLAVRLLVGAASGVIVPLAFAIVGRLDNPERAFGLMIGGLLIYAGIFLGVMPWLTSAAGVAGLMGGMLFTCCLAMLSMHWLPADRATDPAAAQRTFTWPVAGHRMALVGMLVFFTQITSFWSFASVIAQANKVSDGAVALALAVSQFAGIAGTALPAAMGERLPLLRALGLAILACTAAAAILLARTDATTFMVAVLLFHFGWNLGHSYLLALFARLDHTSNLIVMATAMQKAGIAAGPAIAAGIYGAKGSAGVLLASLALGLCAMAALTPAAKARETAKL
jgi:predicted MFS family arabinose efflux permease